MSDAGILEMPSMCDNKQLFDYLTNAIGRRYRYVKSRYVTFLVEPIKKSFPECFI